MILIQLKKYERLILLLSDYDDNGDDVSDGVCVCVCVCVCVYISNMGCFITSIGYRLRCPGAD